MKLTDNFDRASSATAGNGWFEKTNHFSIVNNGLQHVGTADDGYYNILAFRPDDVLDAEIDVNVIYPASDTAIDIDANVAMRATSGSSTYDVFDGYLLWMYRDYIGIDREEAADAWTAMDEVDIDPPLDVSVPHRIVFKVTGTTDVKLDATIYRSDGSVAARLSAVDTSAKRYSAAGRAGLGGGSSATGLRWDNFIRTTF